jgi:hypothetical protein
MRFRKGVIQSGNKSGSYKTVNETKLSSDEGVSNIQEKLIEERNTVLIEVGNSSPLKHKSTLFPRDGSDGDEYKDEDEISNSR